MNLQETLCIEFRSENFSWRKSINPIYFCYPSVKGLLELAILAHLVIELFFIMANRLWAVIGEIVTLPSPHLFRAAEKGDQGFHVEGQLC